MAAVSSLVASPTTTESALQGSTSTAAEATPAPTTTTTTTTTDTFGWDPVLVTPAGDFTNASLAIGPAGWLIGVSEDSYQAPTLHYSQDGANWKRAAELPITRSSIGAPLVGVGIDGMVAIKIGDPESNAFGEPSELAVWISSDGTSWIEGDPDGFAGSGYLYDLQYTSLGWLAAGESYRNSHDVVPAIYHSKDGVSWARVFRGDRSGAARAIVERDGQVLVLGSHQSRPTVWRSGNGTKWRATRLPSETHGGKATAGAWVGDRWIVVGTGSETEAISTWTSGDGVSWGRDGRAPATETGASYARSLGSGTLIEGSLVVSARSLRFAHENFCFERAPCFVTRDSLVVTNDGDEWHELPVPPRSGPRAASELPAIVAGPDGTIASVTRSRGSIVLWTRPGISDAHAIEVNPPVPALSVERAEWGQDLDPGVPYAYVKGTHYGISQLGVFNG